MALSTAEELWLELRQQDNITVMSHVKAATTQRQSAPLSSPLPTPTELMSGRLPPWVQHLWEQMKADESASAYAERSAAETRNKKRSRCVVDDDLTELALRQCSLNNQCTTLTLWGPPKLLLPPPSRSCRAAKKRARTRAHPATREHLDAITRLVSEL